MTRPFKRTILGVAVGAALHASAWGNPTGPNVVSGVAVFSNPGASTLRIDNSPGAIIHWNGFSIGAAEVTRFQQESAASAVLNRVVGGDPSSILGTLSSNGRVFLVNPNGILFGAGAVVDVQGLVASTRDISNADFAAGNYLFEGTSNAGITVQSGARISTASAGAGGQVWLFAKNVSAAAGSEITAPQGQVVLAAGTQLHAAQSTLGSMTFNVATDGTSDVQSLGIIAAQRGAVGMFADHIVQGGRVEAPSGNILLSATRDLTVSDGAVVTADGAGPDGGGAIALRAGNRLEVDPGATVSADGGLAGGAGGSVTLSGNDVEIGPLAYMLHNIRAASRSAGAADGMVTIDQTPPAYVQIGQLETRFDTEVQGAQVAGLADGGYAVAWTTGASRDDTAYVQRYAADGEPVGGPITIATAARAFRIAPLAYGGFVAIWTVEDPSTSDYDPTGFVQRFSATGASLGTPATFDAGGVLNSQGYNEHPYLTSLSDGGFVVTLNRATFGGVFLGRTSLRFDQAGNPVPGDHGFLPAPNGHTVVGETPGFTLDAVGLTRVDAAGAAMGAAGIDPALVDSAVGGLLANPTIGDGAAGRVQPLDFSGNPRGSGYPVQPIASGLFLGGNLTSLSNGAYVAQWRHNGGGATTYFQVFDHGGDALTSAQASNLPSANLRSVVPAPNGGFVTFSLGDRGGEGADAFHTQTFQRYAMTPAAFTPVNAMSGDLPGVLTPTGGPTVVTGNPGGGASFGGVAGCNASVCDRPPEAIAAGNAFLSIVPPQYRRPTGEPVSPWAEEAARITTIENAEQLGSVELNERIAESKRELQRFLKVWEYIQKTGISESEREAQILLNLEPDERDAFLRAREEELRQLAQEQLQGSEPQ